MKKVVSGNVLKEKMIEAIDLLCDTVKVTLGPKGNNVIIDHSNFSPFITNDGVTIAENIESDDKITNTILELAKEASIKTNEIVGDGTTTTLVLLQSIFKEGLKVIDSGVSPIILKQEIDESLNKIIELLKSISRKPTNNDLLNIATISANDKEIGKLISEAYFKTQNKDAIKIIETNDTDCSLNFIKGYNFETVIALPYFFNEIKEINLKNSKILIIDKTLEGIEEVANVLNEALIKNLNLVIIAQDYDNYLVNEIISINMENESKIYLLKSPNYGNKQKSILKDISIITGAKIIDNIASLNDIGNILQIKINDETTNISFEMSNNIKYRIKELELQIKNTDNSLDKDFYNNTIAMFDTCLANINVGATTVTERREKKMRFDDALCAIDIATNGVLPGTGLTLLEISDNLEPQNNSDKILKNAIIMPIKQIISNAGLDPNSIIEEIRNSSYKKLYNVKTDTFESIVETCVIDPTEVVINSLKNACSIAGMLLTTSNLVINEYKNSLNKINDYNEL